MQIIIIETGFLKTNCYLLVNEETNATTIIDPGDDFSIIKNKIDDLNLKPKEIYLTHGHFDHIMAADALR
jgi:glyoxylase-like metal-dependent hydrolase (beta-lactamase superfamily II)